MSRLSTLAMTMLPSKGWASYEAGIRTLGERRPLPSADDLRFLESLALTEASNTHALSPAGQAYFRARFIDDDLATAKALLRTQLLKACPEASAVAQSFANRPGAPRSVAELVLRNQGYGEDLTSRRLGSLLALMSWAEVIDYSKREAEFRVLANPMADDDLPQSIFISPETPWTNRKRLEQIISAADGYLYWLDKHFLPPGLDCLGTAIDGDQIDRVRVLSLELEESKSRRARRAYRDLGRELAVRTVDFEWRFIDSKHIRDTHDRWIISASRAWNVPNLNAILSGQHSEISETGNRDNLLQMFERAWDLAPAHPFDPVASVA
jgi:hypothetical protein